MEARNQGHFALAEAILKQIEDTRTNK